MNTRLLCISLACLASACGSDSPAEPVILEFRGENDLLAGFEQDSGFLPPGSPAALRVVTSATASLVATAQATAAGDMLTPTPGAGSLALEAGLSLEISARLDAAGVDYEGVVETFEYAIEPATASFEPFAIGETVTLESALPPGELARVPIPSVPGATLVVDIAGGQVNTAYSGVCAVALGGLAQYTAEAVVDGTIELEGTIELKLLVVTETFGPFAIEVPIPATTTAVDLGTFSTSDGMLAQGSPCDAAGADTDAPEPTTDSGTTDDGTSDGGTTDNDPTADDSSSSDPGSESSSTGCGMPGSCDPQCMSDVDCGAGESCNNDACIPVPTVCLNGLDCSACPSSESCSSCVQLDDNACADVVDSCFSDYDCNLLAQCVNSCRDQACVDACAADSTGLAIDLINAALMCISGACA